jgi:hypothetical protein
MLDRLGVDLAFLGAARQAGREVVMMAEFMDERRQHLHAQIQLDDDEVAHRDKLARYTRVHSAVQGT